MLTKLVRANQQKQTALLAVFLCLQFLARLPYRSHYENSAAVGDEALEHELQVSCPHFVAHHLCDG